MSTISFTAPNDDDQPFPATIAGTYTLANNVAAAQQGAFDDPEPGMNPNPTVSVWIVASDNSYSSGPHAAGVVPANLVSGSWSLPKPAGVPAGKSFTITAMVSHPTFASATNSVTDITT